MFWMNLFIVVSLSLTGETSKYWSGYGAEEEHECYWYKDTERGGTAEETLTS